MPRTKARKTKNVKAERLSVEPENDDIDAKIKLMKQYIKQQKDLMEKLLMQIDMELLLHPAEVLEMTLKELEEKKSFISSSLSSINTSKKTRRSRSVQQNKSRTVTQNRSLSRNRNGTIINNKYVTPVTQRNITMGTVTPKITPGMTTVLLRKPALGENVISMQGSPLLVQTTSTDEEACVHVPLSSGHVYAIRSQTGQLTNVPSFDENVRKQLFTLQRNLNQVCATLKHY